jgi:DNA-binding transcriptional LysR family regulator
MNLGAINLNLLVALEALLSERSVTRAARRLGVTQPAMSNSLAQLRALLNDPLFHRRAHGLEPTARALALSEPLQQGLRLLAGAFEPQRFEPSASLQSFVVEASDYVEFVLLPPLLQRLAAEAPGVRVEVRPWGLHEVPSSLGRGEADLMIGFYDEVPARHRQRILFEEEYVCVVRKGHPRVGRGLTLERYLELGHVLVSQRGDTPGSVDRALLRKGKRRHVAARVSHFLMVPMLVRRTDLVAALSRRVAEPFADALGLNLFEPPLSLPRGKIGQVWHERLDQDPAQAWFRGVVESVCHEL